MSPLAVLNDLDPPIVLRRAVRDDVPAIVGLLAADQLGAGRESASHEPYLRAFDAIDADPAHLLLVAEIGEPGTAAELVGTLQLSVLPGLARQGAARAQIEAVRVRSDLRGRRLGEFMLQWTIDESRRRGCRLVQLTTDKSRDRAHRFYERLGFVASHEGMKLALDG